jgi:hypothetical protein
MYIYSTTNRSVRINKSIRMTEITKSEERLLPNAKTNSWNRTPNHRSVGDSHRGTFLNIRENEHLDHLFAVYMERMENALAVHFHYRYWSIVR